ncbi:MAG: hypothetical protein Q7R22_007470 [Verrucomicrobiota bacterium JB025]|nr:hypothetical protein [Verrucomicrobiota bacterium JB025]
MKLIKFTLAAAILACGVSYAAETAYTTPVGYYTFDGSAGGNVFVPSFVEPAAFSGEITAATATTMTVSGSLTANAFDAGASYATYYVEITSGDNEGVVIDIASNTDSEITLDSDVSALSLTGSETIAIRPHVTLGSALEGGASVLAAYADSASFYNTDGSISTYVWDGAGNWTSNFIDADGNDRPIPPATGFVLNVTSDVDLVVSGEVKSGATVVQLTAGVVNIVGPTNPLVGDSTPIADLGFSNMAAYADSLTIYDPGTLGNPVSYLADGAGNVTVDFISASTDEMNHTTGGVLTASGDTSLRIDTGL